MFHKYVKFQAVNGLNAVPQLLVLFFLLRKEPAIIPDVAALLSLDLFLWLL
jgi:hypothetical protein